MAGPGRLICILAVLAIGALRPCSAQELEPRRWSHLPIGSNFLGAGYGYAETEISDAPAFRLEDVKLQMHTVAARYIRSFELLGKTARAELSQAYQKGHWEGLLDGAPASTRRAGWADTIARFAMNIYGAPPLRGKEYAAYRASRDVETIVGVGLEVQLPTGEYDPDRLINLGTNRYTFRPQIGVVHNRGPWSMELTSSAWFYTDNDEFFRGNTVEQDPLLTIQGYLSYTFSPGFWVDLGAAYGYGAQSTVNGVKRDDRKENVGWTVNMGYPLAPDLALKVGYIGLRRHASTGNDYDTISFVISHVF